MEEDRKNILCTKIDPNAGNWPSDAFVELFRVAKRCVEPKLPLRPEIAEVSYNKFNIFFRHPFNGLPQQWSVKNTVPIEPW